jgi:SSS family solute:Na+ symporter/sodium/pantothenate symporter
MSDVSATQSGAVLVALLVFIAASVWLGTLAQRAIDKGRFLEGFFLGNRGLGAWALALTATVQSGGTFMGFPALVYSHGWIVALWIGSYMVVPLTGFAIIGKRLAQLSRRTGAITVPDLFRERFASPAVGLIASLLIMLFMTFMMMAQFKAGAIIMKLAWPGSGMLAFGEDMDAAIDVKYYTGLAIFSLTVIGYTLIGGFLASVWTDLFQSVMMLFGVLLLVCLAVPAAGGLEHATREAVRQTADTFASGPGYFPPRSDGLVRQFLTPGLAVSMFFIWVWGGFSSPASMVRVMAAGSTEVIRKSIVLLSLYNCLIYIPLILVCISARAIVPNLEKPDETVPRMALMLTDGLPGGPLLAGVILAAPFGAVMATVSCYLLVISSGVVRDVYLRFLRPHAGVKEVRLVTSLAMIGVGGVAILANLRPPPYLQALVVLSTTCGASALAIPILTACYWRRATRAGTITAMLAGTVTVLSLYAAGWLHTWSLSQVAEHGSSAGPLARNVAQWLGPDQGIGIESPFRPYFLLGLDPLMWGLLASAVCGLSVSRLTTPPPDEHVAWLFDARGAAPREVKLT